MPVYSPKERDSLASKILFYDQYQSSCEHRFRVLFVFTRDSERVRHFLATAAKLTANPQRRLFYAISLPAFLAAENAIEHAAFRDHDGKLQPLVRTPVSQASSPKREKVIDPVLVAW